MDLLQAGSFLRMGVAKFPRLHTSGKRAKIPCACQSAGRPRDFCLEERPGSTGQDGGEQPPEVTRGLVPQKTNRCIEQ